MKSRFLTFKYSLRDITNGLSFGITADPGIKFPTSKEEVNELKEPTFTKQDLLDKHTGLSEQAVDTIFANAGADALTEEQITEGTKSSFMQVMLLIQVLLIKIVDYLLI